MVINYDDSPACFGPVILTPGGTIGWKPLNSYTQTSKTCERCCNCSLTAGVGPCESGVGSFDLFVPCSVAFSQAVAPGVSRHPLRALTAARPLQQPMSRSAPLRLIDRDRRCDLRRDQLRIPLRPAEGTTVADPGLSEPVPVRYAGGQPRIGSVGTGEGTKKRCPNFCFAPRATKAHWNRTFPRFRTRS